MLENEELINLEKKYMDILSNLYSQNLGTIISQLYSQNLFDTPVTNEKTNMIEHATENILEKIIATRLGWNICSLPVSSDSCFECGDAIIHIDAKTTLNTDNDCTNNKVCVEASQTSYNSAEDLLIANKHWKSKLNYYEKHEYFGKIPNLTYLLRVIYSDEHLIEKMIILCLPSGQLYSIFGNNILGAGKVLEARDNNRRKNIRFCIDIIKGFENNEWREVIIFERK